LIAEIGVLLCYQQLLGLDITVIESLVSKPNKNMKGRVSKSLLLNLINWSTAW